MPAFFMLVAEFLAGNFSFLSAINKVEKKLALEIIDKHFDATIVPGPAPYLTSEQRPQTMDEVRFEVRRMLDTVQD